MKILFINTNENFGGASMAMWRLQDSLKQHHGTDNFLIVKNRHTDGRNVFQTTGNKTAWYIERAVDKITNKLGLQYQYFPFSTGFILNKARELSPDVINLHNVHGGFFCPSILPELSKIAPVTWSLHDMWSFTGNAAHTFGDESWTRMKSGPRDKHIYPKIGLDTGAWLLKRKKEFYSRSNLTIISTSEWIDSLARKSPAFENTQIRYIPNGINTDVFKSAYRSECRHELGIPDDAPVLMFTADNLKDNPWKGGRLFHEILFGISELYKKRGYSRPLHLLVFGTGTLDFLESFDNIRTHHITSYIGFTDPQKVAGFYSAADLYIHPAKAETFGLVLQESLACGTPCISFDIGGCSTLVRDEFNGYLVKPFDTADFSKKALDLLFEFPEKRASMSENGRKMILDEFSYQKISDEYMSLFRNLRKD